MKKAVILKLSFLLIALVLILASSACTQNNKDANAYVKRVVDGDTIIVMDQSKKERVRLIGVDTPETVHP